MAGESGSNPLGSSLYQLSDEEDSFLVNEAQANAEAESSGLLKEEVHHRIAMAAAQQDQSSTQVEPAAVRKPTNAISFFSDLGTSQATLSRRSASQETATLRAAAARQKRPNRNSARSPSRSIAKALSKTAKRVDIALGNVGRNPLPQSSLKSTTRELRSPAQSRRPGIAVSKQSTSRPAEEGSERLPAGSRQRGSNTMEAAGQVHQSLDIDQLVQQYTEAIEEIMSRDKLRATDVFRRFDRNGDGQLSQEEFAQGLHQAGIAMTFPDIAALFSELDKEGEGYIRYKTFLRGLQYRHRHGGLDSSAGEAPSLVRVPAKSPHRNCACLSLPNNSSNRSLVAHPASQFSGTKAKSAPRVHVGTEDLGQSLDLADLSIDELSSTARDRARQVLSSSLKASAGQQEVDGTADTSLKTLRNLKGTQHLPPPSELDVSAMSTSGQEKLSGLLNASSGELLNQRQLAQLRLEDLHKQKSTLVSENRKMKERLRDMSGHFGAEAAKLKQEYRHDIKVLEAKLRDSESELMKTQQELAEIDGGHTEIESIRVKVQQGDGISSIEARSAIDESEVAGQLRADLIRHESSIVLQQRSIRAKIEANNSERASITCEIRDLRNKLAGLSGRFGSDAGKLKEQSRSKIKSLETRLKHIDAESRDLDRELSLAIGAQKQVQRLRQESSATPNQALVQSRSQSIEPSRPPPVPPVSMTRSQSTQNAMSHQAEIQRTIEESVKPLQERVDAVHSQLDKFVQPPVSQNVSTNQVDLNRSFDEVHNRISNLQSDLALHKSLGGIENKLDALHTVSVASATPKQDQQNTAKDSVEKEALLQASLSEARSQISKLEQLLMEQKQTTIKHVSQSLLADEAKRIQEAALHEAKSLKNRAEFDAKLVVESAEREARQIRDKASGDQEDMLTSAKREAEQIVMRAKQSADDIYRDRNITYNRQVTDLEDRLSKHQIDEEAHKARIQQMRRELQDLQAQLSTAQIQLDQDKASLLEEERARLQAQADEMYQSLVRDREVFESERAAASATIAAEYERLEVEKKAAYDAITSDREAALEAAAVEIDQAVRKQEADLQNRAESFNNEIEALRGEVGAELQKERESCLTEIESERNHSKTSMQTQKDEHAAHIKSEEDRIKELEEATMKRLKNEEDAVRERLAHEEEQFRTRINAEQEMAQVKLENEKENHQRQLAAEDAAARARQTSEAEQARAELQAELIAARTAHKQEMEKRRSDVENELGAKALAVEQEMKLLEQQVQDEMDGTEEGAHIMRLHMNVKSSRADAAEARKALKSAQIQCEESELKVQQIESLLKQQRAASAALESENTDLESKLREAEDDCETLERQKATIENSLKQARKERLDLVEELQALQDALSTAKACSEKSQKELDDVSAQLLLANDDACDMRSRLLDLEAVEVLANKLQESQRQSQAEYKEEVEKLTTALEDSRQDASNTRSKLATVERQLAEVEGDFQDKLRLLASKAQEVEKLEAALQEAQITCSKARVESEDTRDECTKILRDKERELNELRNKCEVLAKRNAALIEDLKEERASQSMSGLSTAAQLQADTEKYKMEVESLKAKLSTAYQASDQMDASKQAIERKLAEAEGTVKTLQLEDGKNQARVRGLLQELEYVKRDLEDKKSAVDARDRAADAAQQGLADSLAQIRGEADKEKRDANERLRRAQSRCRQLEGELQSAQDEVASERSKYERLHSDLRVAKAECMQIRRKNEEAAVEIAGIKKQADAEMADLKDRLQRTVTAHAELEARAAVLNGERERLAMELSSVQKSLKENLTKIPKDPGPSREEFRRVLGMLENSVATKNTLVSKLDQAYKEQNIIQDELARVQSSSHSVAVQLEQSRKDVASVSQLKSQYTDMWAAANSQLTEEKNAVSEIRDHVADIRRREINTASALDSLNATTREIETAVGSAHNATSALRERIAQAEANAAAQAGLLGAELGTSRAQLNQLATSNAELLQANVQREREAKEAARLASEVAASQARERDHRETLSAYMTEVGEQRREIEALRSQLGAAEGQSILLTSVLGETQDAGPLSKSYLAP